MNKDTYIRTRLSERTKADFDSLCKSLDVVPSEQLRLMIEAFVSSHSDSGKSRFAIQIYRPEGYDYGVWRVTVSLRNPEDGLWLGTPIPFVLPELPKRLVQSDPEYRAVVIPNGNTGPVIGGYFDKGVWRGHIRSNGCEEALNPTGIEQVEDALRAIIDSTLERFHGYPSYLARQKKLMEQSKSTEVIGDWIRSKVIWTKNPQTAGSGKPTPGIYGQNIVIGFCDSVYNDDNLYVISRYISRPADGNLDGHHLYVTKFEDWVTHMVPIDDMQKN